LLLPPPLLLLLSAANNYRPNCVGGVVGDGVRSRSTRRAAFAILLYNVKTQRTRHTNARAAPTAITVAIPVFSHPPTTTSHVSQVLLLHTIDYSPRSSLLQRRRIHVGQEKEGSPSKTNGAGSFHDCPPLYYIMANLMDEQVSPKDSRLYSTIAVSSRFTS
jgi:hypothetical protein